MGPACDSKEGIRELVRAGVDAFRLNLSHGTTATHRTVLERIRSVTREEHTELAIVADVPGPKLRLGELATSPLRLVPGRPWRLDSEPAPGDGRRVGVELPRFWVGSRPGDVVLLGDGRVELRVHRVASGGVDTTVVHGGLVASHSGVHLPHARFRGSWFAKSDRTAALEAVTEGVDFLALSFVRSARDVLEVRRWLGDVAPSRPVGVIAKIERPEALEAIDGILAASDGIMVARGDLGLSLPLEKLALEQKRLVLEANLAGKFAIVATQMLLSMLTSSRPTRAEATDVANAVLDGADVLMLSDETAIGEYPFESVRWLARIAEATEPAFDPRALREARARLAGTEPDRAVARAAVTLAEAVEARVIATPTHSGRTARLVAALRPNCPVVAMSSSPHVRRQLRLVSGVLGRPALPHSQLQHLSVATRELARELGFPKGGVAVLTAGYPVEGRPTNLLTLVDLTEGPGGSEHPRPRPSHRANAPGPTRGRGRAGTRR